MSYVFPSYVGTWCQFLNYGILTQFQLNFFSKFFLVKDCQTGAPLMRGETIDGVYCAPISFPPQVNTTSLASLSDWHHRLGHPSNKTLGHVLCRCTNISNLALNHFSCISCNINKSHKLPFKTNSLVSSRPLELIYTDVWSSS